MTKSTSCATLPNDVLWKIFSNIPNADPGTLSLVCRSWNSFFTDENKIEANFRFWKPLFLEMCSKNIQESTDKQVSPNFQAVVKTFFKDNRTNIDFIVNLIGDDQQLAKCLHTSNWKLDEFKAKPVFERSRIIWKALHHDATPILVMLQEKWMPEYLDFMMPLTNLKSDFSLENGDHFKFEQDRNNLLNQFRNSEKFSPIILSLIQTHNVPYNKVDFICALLTSIYISNHAQTLLFQIVKSHEDLSELHNKEFYSFGSSTPVGSSVISLCLSGNNTGITTQDLVHCKLMS